MDLLAQLCADQLGVTVRRPTDLETTSRGAAFLAGIAEGVWDGLESLAETWTLEREFAPTPDRDAPDAAYATWLRAVERSRNWQR